MAKSKGKNIHEEIVKMKKQKYWIDLLIILVIALMIIVTLHFLEIIQLDLPNTTILNGDQNNQLYNEDEFQQRVDEYLEKNLVKDEARARDVAYHDIAINENRISLCDLIQDQGLKTHCHRSLGE